MKIKEFITGMFAVVLFFGSIGIAGYLENHYSMECKVAEYNGNKCIVDVVGQRWYDDRCESFDVGDEVQVLFDTNTTDSTRYDDIIVSIK